MLCGPLHQLNLAASNMFQFFPDSVNSPANNGSLDSGVQRASLHAVSYRAIALASAAIKFRCQHSFVAGAALDKPDLTMGLTTYY